MAGIGNSEGLMGGKIKKVSCPEDDMMERLFKALSSKPSVEGEKRVYGRAGGIETGENACTDGYELYPADAKKMFCAPCQTIKYICPSAVPKIRTTKICPKSHNKDGSNKGEKLYYAEARRAAWRLFEMGCKIKTPGFFCNEFKNWMKNKEKAQKQKNTSKPSVDGKTKGQFKEIPAQNRPKPILQQAKAPK